MRWLRAWLLGLTLIVAALPAGAAGLTPELDLGSPRATYQTFYAELRRVEELYRAYAAERSNAAQFALLRGVRRFGLRMFDLSHLPPATRDKHALSAIGIMADIMLRLPAIPPETIPGTPPTPAAELPAYWTIPGTELRMERLTAGPWAGSYAFTAETLERLPEFHAEIIGQPLLHPSYSENWQAMQQRFAGPLLHGLPMAGLPAPLQALVLGTPLWKSLLAACVIALVVSALLLAGRVVRRRAAGGSELRRRAIGMIMPVLLALLVVAGEFVIAWEIGLGGLPFDANAMLAAMALFGAAAWAAWLGCHLVVELIIALPAIPDNSYDAHLLRLLARVVAVVAVVLLIVYGANTIGVPALGLLAGVSVGGIALALAAQSTVENLFGGISILADRPFRVGDTIQGGSVSGAVEAVGPRSSRIRRADGTLTTVPNSDLAKMHITNMSARSGFLFRHTIRLGGEATRAQAEWLLAALRERVAAEPCVTQDPPPRVRLIGFGEASLDLEVFAKVPVATQAEFLEVQEGLILEIMRAVETGGLRLAMAPQPLAPQPIALQPIASQPAEAPAAAR
ncbi:MAG: mechanosensitive ion channel family protein [Acetobacteraceae bacterium]|nr:mechanosensitive ion channel family protein [Acetobacteraceae bacterium]